MMAMTPTLRWADVALRLALTVAAGILVGYNRSEHGKAAGMRTTLLVCLAASVAMLQVNALLPMAGRASNSFVMNDLMRLPLGILTGVGFIGGGAILRRGDLLVGVTTAATLWLATVIGLCFGGGQITLGVAATGLGLFALWVLKWVENRLPQESRARLSITVDASGPGDAEIRRQVREAGLSILRSRLEVRHNGTHRELAFELGQFGPPGSTEVPAPIADLARAPGVLRLEWQGHSWPVSAGG